MYKRQVHNIITQKLSTVKQAQGGLRKTITKRHRLRVCTELKQRYLQDDAFWI